MPTSDARIRIIPASQYRRERWRNGLGWTREIARVPQQGQWNWRLSIAEIECTAAFSQFPGVERELVLLSGNGLRLRFEDGEARELIEPHTGARFAGEAEVTGELIDGATTDFNLMWRRDAVHAELWRRPLVGAMVVFVDPGHTWAVHLLAGQTSIGAGQGAETLHAGDTALIETGRARGRAELDGGGEALLIRLTPRQSGTV